MGNEEGYDMEEVSKGKGRVSIYDKCPECGGEIDKNLILNKAKCQECD